jgi:hypothetical protein
MVGVAVAAQDHLRVVLLEQVQHDVPVRDAVIYGVMGDEDDGLVGIGQLL